MLLQSAVDLVCQNKPFFSPSLSFYLSSSLMRSLFIRNGSSSETAPRTSPFSDRDALFRGGQKTSALSGYICEPHLDYSALGSRQHGDCHSCTCRRRRRPSTEPPLLSLPTEPRHSSPRDEPEALGSTGEFFFFISKRGGKKTRLKKEDKNVRARKKKDVKMMPRRGGSWGGGECLSGSGVVVVLELWCVRHVGGWRGETGRPSGCSQGAPATRLCVIL